MGNTPITADALLELDTNWHYAQSDGRQHYLLKAKHGRRVIGRAHGWFAPNASFVLEKIELDQRHRSKGFGTSMIACLRAQARHQHCTRFVFAGVMRNNAGAIRLYESMDAVVNILSDERCEYILSPP